LQEVPISEGKAKSLCKVFQSIGKNPRAEPRTQIPGQAEGGGEFIKS